jgi:hypothetical protein
MAVLRRCGGTRLAAPAATAASMNSRGKLCGFGLGFADHPTFLLRDE